MDLLTHVRCTIERDGLLLPGETVVVGVSGGPDSLVLLHLLMRLRSDLNLRLHVGHLDHQLRGSEAAADAAYVQQLAARWGVPATIEARDVGALSHELKIAVEEAARQARYAFLASLALRVGARVIAVGHNADDQVETVLMHFLRGSGLAGLRGMQPVTRLEQLRLPEISGDQAALHELRLVRPLLTIPRRDIKAYCAEHGLEPRFDRSNLDTTLFRNRLRHELIPYLETFNPRVRAAVLNMANVLAADHAYLEQQADRVWQEVVLWEQPDAIAIALSQWRSLPLSLQRSVVRRAVQHLRQSLRDISLIHVEAAVELLKHGTTGQAGTLPRGLEARLLYDRILIADREYRESPDPSLEDGPAKVEAPGRTVIPGTRWALDVEQIPRERIPSPLAAHSSKWEVYLDADRAGPELMLRTRMRGDRFWPQGFAGPTRLNDWMTTAKIPRAWRDRLALLASPSMVLWVPGHRIDERVRITNATRSAWHIRLFETSEG